MENIELILTVINTIAAVVSSCCAVISVKAKNEAKKIYMSHSGNGNARYGDVWAENSGDNSGTIIGVNNGEHRK